MNSQEQMAFSIVEAVNQLFDNESDFKKYEWRKINLTDFFTAYIKAGTHMYNKVTGDDKNHIEFTHLANSLIVQALVDKGVSHE